MTYLTILCATLAVTSAQIPGRGAPQRETIIQNKNINIVVNLNAREVAEELWKVIEARLKNGTSQQWNIIKDLEKVVAPLVSPSRRGATPPSVFQVANKFDEITRRVLTRNSPDMNVMDEEIMTRDIVTDMMVSLKMILSRTIEDKTIEEPNESPPSGRRMSPVATYDDDYVNVRIKMHKQDILDMLR